MTPEREVHSNRLQTLDNPYGEILSSSGSTVNLFRWVGKLGYQDDGFLNTHYVRQRYYGTKTARWMSRDPLPGHTNSILTVPVVGAPEIFTQVYQLRFDQTRLYLERYSYCFDNPSTLVDPSGLAAAGVIGGVGVCVALPEVCLAAGIIAGVVVIGGIIYYLLAPAVAACLESRVAYCYCCCWTPAGTLQPVGYQPLVECVSYPTCFCAVDEGCKKIDPGLN